MNVRLKNVGIVKDSEIIIDGITVITGKNSSGKSTVSKVLYSLVSSIENLFENATCDIVSYITNELTDTLRNSRLSEICRRLGIHFDHYDDSNQLTKMLIDIYKDNYDDIHSIDDARDYIISFIEALPLIDEEYIENIKVPSILKNTNTLVGESLTHTIDDLVSKCNQLINRLDELSDFSEYEHRKLSKMFKTEFDNQFLPVKIKEKLTFEVDLLSDDNKYSYKYTEGFTEISGDLIINGINNVVFIDDVTVVDAIRLNLDQRRFFMPNANLTNFIRARDHKYSLIDKLSEYNFKHDESEDDAYKKVKDKIDSVFKDDIVVKDGKYVCSSDNLTLTNLATGSKLFAILKILLQNGSLNSDTLLVLDEPESHLHPEWQNIVSELIVILAKELGVKIVITSHSPNFVLAVQTYGIKYDLSNNMNFYKTKSIDGYLVEYQNVNNDLSPIYSDFAKQFSSIKSLYDYLVLGESND